uniref:protein TPX2 isoform X2 n=1 Tax=Erigeron canadensis TaxID=72917 RepID=UPI001CB95F65|nr:protein TPX2 isoform X2 [Erigeron canadensis]
MEVEMEDDNRNGDDTAVEFTFTAVEIDLDYEYEAARFFDFTRPESIDEARQAEMWFHSLQSYPPSPFAVRLLSQEQCEKASKFFSDTNQLESVSSVLQAPDYSTMAVCSTDANGANGGVPSDLKSYCLPAIQKQHPASNIPHDSTRNGNLKSKTKPSWKPSVPRTSTLMKPTASQLAKQNHERLMDKFRFQKLGTSSSGIESQAPKRQKLDGGHLCKAIDTNQQPNFVHKAPNKEVTADSDLSHTRLRITVPRPPELATAQRAQRIRQKADNGNEHVASRVPGFRARPLNRKIFDTPSLLMPKRSTPQLPEFKEFHLQTTERALQNTSAVPSTSAYCNNLKAPQKPSFALGAESSSRESKEPLVAGVPKQDSETIHRFKALSFNKKIPSSKGDPGAFKSSKRETTVAMAFDFQTEKRAQPAPPVDLFNKLSLASESGSQLHRPRSRPSSFFTKGLKENRVCSFQQQSEVSVPKMGSKQVQSYNHNVITEGTPLSNISRNMGIR